MAFAEDFTNLIILNNDDSEFELNSLLKDKEQYSTYIMREFLKQNSSPVTKELSSSPLHERQIIEKFDTKWVKIEIPNVYCTAELVRKIREFGHCNLRNIDPDFLSDWVLKG